MEYIKVANLSFSYGGERDVIKNFSLEINKNGLYVLMGENGSGKTTLLKILIKYINGYRGSVKILGKDLKEFSLKEISREIAFLESEIPEIPLKVREVLSWGRFPYGENEFKKEYLIGVLNLSNVMEKKFSSLSSGERKRVLLGRIFVQRSKIVLIDEPFNFLDPRYKIEIADMLKILSRDRVVLIATHNLNAARYLGEIIFLLKGGELKGVLSKDDVFSLDAIADIFGIKDSMKKEFLKFYNIEQY